MSQSKVEALQVKLEAAQAAVRKVQAEIESLTRFADIKEGDTVGFSFGRGENKENLNGKVVAIGQQSNGVNVVNVLVGTGIDVSIKRIPRSTINAHVPADVAEVAYSVTDAAAA